jgi:hypothetical protein
MSGMASILAVLRLKIAKSAIKTKAITTVALFLIESSIKF